MLDDGGGISPDACRRSQLVLHMPEPDALSKVLVIRFNADLRGGACVVVIDDLLGAVFDLPPADADIVKRPVIQLFQ